MDNRITILNVESKFVVTCVTQNIHCVLPHSLAFTGAGWTGVFKQHI